MVEILEIAVVVFILGDFWLIKKRTFLSHGYYLPGLFIPRVMDYITNLY